MPKLNDWKDTSSKEVINAAQMILKLYLYYSMGNITPYIQTSFHQTTSEEVTSTGSGAFRLHL